jgi:methyltransferase of ATP-grasp peptide maturase system
LPFTEQELRIRLADELEAEGSLRSPQWRAAVERVPRHLFIPEFFRRVNTDSGVAWAPVITGGLPEAERMELAYRNETWVTQLDQKTRPADAGGVVISGHPTSSSTLPGLVIGMLEDLDVRDRDTIMEIGTGSGYSTALLCERAGSANIVSIEADAGIAADASAAIHAAGYSPVLVVGDGLAGFAQRRPYSKLVATCSVRSIPAAWIDQAAPGATILTTISGWQYGSAYARLTREEDGTARGRFLADTYSFMLARSHQPPSAGLGSTAKLDSVKARTSKIAPETLDRWEGRFIAQLANPDVQVVTRKSGDDPMTDYLIDRASRSVASLMPDSAGEYQVREIGPVGLWSRVEESITFWQRAGSPSLAQFRIEISPRSQRVYIADDEALCWYLPAS